LSESDCDSQDTGSESGTTSARQKWMHPRSTCSSTSQGIPNPQAAGVQDQVTKDLRDRFKKAKDLYEELKVPNQHGVWRNARNCFKRWKAAFVLAQEMEKHADKSAIKRLGSCPPKRKRSKGKLWPIKFDKNKQKWVVMEDDPTYVAPSRRVTEQRTPTARGPYPTERSGTKDSTATTTRKSRKPDTRKVNTPCHQSKARSRTSRKKYKIKKTDDKCQPPPTTPMTDEERRLVIKQLNEYENERVARDSNYTKTDIEDLSSKEIGKKNQHGFHVYEGKHYFVNAGIGFEFSTNKRKMKSYNKRKAFKGMWSEKVDRELKKIRAWSKIQSDVSDSLGPVPTWDDK